MGNTHQDIESFAQFARAKSGGELSIEQLFALWRLENPTPTEQSEIREAIRHGLAEADAGVGRPIDEFMDEFRAKHDIPTDA